MEKPTCKIIGEDGNIFNLIGIVSRTLKENGSLEMARKMQKRIMEDEAGSYNEALRIIMEYVEVE